MSLEGYAGYAFCSLGEKLAHYLIDEFQDTSIQQFSAMYPLIENAKSEGGSLFVVGDKKQAIYAWRGGDYRLFNALSGMKNDTINDNYRSKTTIVDFNNMVFGIDNVKKITGHLTGNNDVEFAKILDKDLKDIYAKSNQDTKTKGNGFVSAVVKKEEDRDFDKDDFMRNQLRETLSELLDNGVEQSDIMILLRTKKDIGKIVEFIRSDFKHLNFITEDSLVLINNPELKKLLFVGLASIYSTDFYFIEALKEIGVDLNLDELGRLAKQLMPYEFFCYLLQSDIFKYTENRSYFDTLLEKVVELSQNKKDLEYIIRYFYEHPDISVSSIENVNAIRIMTIHKSKGLESHTVIIPYYDWKLIDKKRAEVYSEFDIGHLLNLNKDAKIFAKADSALRVILKEARDAYFEQLKINTIEALNLMYVANTRACDNLFIIGTFKSIKDGKECPSDFPVSCLLGEILAEDKNLGDVEYKIGTIQASPKPKQTEREKLTEIDLGANIRDYLKIYPQIYELNIEPEEKLYGELFHQAMAFIGSLNRNGNVENTAKEAYEMAKSVIGYEDESVVDDIKKAVEALGEYFFDIDEYYNEKEFVDKNGDIRRIDRLVKRRGEYIVLDYKTGKKEQKHKKQVGDYLNLFDNANGIIYYSKTGDVEYV